MRKNNKPAVFSILIILLTVIISFQCKSNQNKKNLRPVTEIAGWFEAKLVADRVWCISDHGTDNMYLVEGDDKALLIDTGIGVADLARYVQTITKLPVIVVNTHGHPDHVGGNFQFSEVYTHPLDFELTGQFSSQTNHEHTIQQTMKNNPGFESPFIKDTTAYKIPSLLPVKAGYIFDLGNRKLEVIEVSGHTRGSIVLLDAGNKLLFTGDNNNTLVWLFLDGCLPLEAYLQTLQKLNQRSAEFDYILPGHGDILDKSFINDQIICAQQIISGECKGEKYESFAGSALKCTYQRASIAFNPDNIHIKR
jgi:glyoxylase-like metal-dependent hydrolase (beta-lactamase superfamily II)